MTWPLATEHLQLLLHHRASMATAAAAAQSRGGTRRSRRPRGRDAERLKRILVGQTGRLVGSQYGIHQHLSPAAFLLHVSSMTGCSEYNTASFSFFETTLSHSRAGLCPAPGRLRRRRRRWWRRRRRRRRRRQRRPRRRRRRRQRRPTTPARLGVAAQVEMESNV